MTSWKRICALLVAALILAGYALPQRLVIPVAGATLADWNRNSFWYAPWGESGVHKGIDIFAEVGTPVLAASPGLVLYAGGFGRGGLVVMVLGPKWRVHYYAHLSSARVTAGDWVSRVEMLGEVGVSGNAAATPAHLHYSIFTPIPYPWRFREGPQGWLLPFFLDPGEELRS